MTAHEYLQNIVESQKLTEDSDELSTLRDHRDEIEGHLREAFGSSPKIRYGGSHAKGTLVKDSYDLDIVCYFPRDDSDAGATLEEIFNNVKDVLAKHYTVRPKTSALHVRTNDSDLHVDVVPGRFIDEATYDAFLFRAVGDKCRMKTNIETHIAHVKNSGVTDAIKLMKIWRTRHNVPLKTFIVELLTVDILKGSTANLDTQMRKVFETLRDAPETITVKDPANLTGNDLSEIWNEQIRSTVSAMARSTLATIDAVGWEGVFGKLPEAEKTRSSVEALRAAATAVAAPARPWRR